MYELVYQDDGTYYSACLLDDKAKEEIQGKLLCLYDALEFTEYEIRNNNPHDNDRPLEENWEERKNEIVEFLKEYDHHEEGFTEVLEEMCLECGFNLVKELKSSVLFKGRVLVAYSKGTWV